MCILTISAAEIAHRDLTVTPHGADNGIERSSGAQSVESDAQVPAIDGREAERALIHIEYDEELIGSDESGGDLFANHFRIRIDFVNYGFRVSSTMMRRRRRRVVDVRGGMKETVSAQIPAPRVVVAADERPVPSAVKRRVACCDADNRVSAAVAR